MSFTFFFICYSYYYSPKNDEQTQNIKMYTYLPLKKKEIRGLPKKGNGKSNERRRVDKREEEKKA